MHRQRTPISTALAVHLSAGQLAGPHARRRRQHGKRHPRRTCCTALRTPLTVLVKRRERERRSVSVSSSGPPEPSAPSRSSLRKLVPRQPSGALFNAITYSTAAAAWGPLVLAISSAAPLRVTKRTLFLVLSLSKGAAARHSMEKDAGASTRMAVRRPSR